MTSNIEPKDIIEGFSDDLQTILVEYSKCSQNLRLEDFFAFWRASSMDCIFANRFDPRELLESIVAINEKLVSIITDDLKDPAARLIGLYILVCVSAKQPGRLRRKIRMTCSDAIRVNDLCNETGISYGHQDATFCWYHLRKLGSVDFVEDRITYGPSLLKTRKQQESRQAELATEVAGVLKDKNCEEFIETKLEPALSDLEEFTKQYNQIREVLHLSSTTDATVDEQQLKGSVQDHLDQAKNLLRDFKASQT